MPIARLVALVLALIVCCVAAPPYVAIVLVLCCGYAATYVWDILR